MITHHNFIDGAWTPSDSGEVFENRNPADPDEVIGLFQQSRASDAHRALDAARRAYASWRLVPAPKRAEILFRAAQLIAELHALRNAASSNEQSRKELAGSLKLLGFFSRSAAEWEGQKRQASGVDPDRVTALIADRTAARGRKDFKESDRIRDELAAMGVAIKDSKEGTTWEVAR